MACDVPPREELALHIQPHTRKPKPSPDGTSIRVLCPVPEHDDHEHSCIIGIGDHQKIVWHCFKGCSRLRVRAALIAAGVHPGCLPLGRAERDGIIEQLTRILAAPTSDHANVRLRALAALEGYRELPRGGDLIGLASRAAIGRRYAFALKKRQLPSPDNRST